VIRRLWGIWTSRWLGAMLDIAMRPRPVLLNRAGFVTKQFFDTAFQPFALIHLQSSTNSECESIRSGRECTIRTNLFRILDVRPMFFYNGNIFNLTPQLYTTFIFSQFFNKLTAVFFSNRDETIG
jgi:hypothetical protein